MNGVIKWYHSQKGYGFITNDEGKDIFVHRSQIPSGTYLREGDKVSFDIEEDERGPKAVNLKKL
ncbi:MAG: cold-shock protein [Candidatus Thermoplasmatota archaeon]|nr:cold-shock protein [Candidatus Thermoplasmatota archaeon]